MDMQIGFDFGSAKVNTQKILEKGAWGRPEFTVPQIEELLRSARNVLAREKLPEPLASIYASGLSRHEDRLFKAKSSPNPFGRKSEQGHPLAPSEAAVVLLEDSTVDFLIKACIANNGRTVNGIRHIAHNNVPDLLGYSSFGLYLTGVGTIDITAWPGHKFHVIHWPYEENVMLPHYEDSMAVIEASYKLWHNVYSAEKISGAKKWGTNLPIFSADGRDMIINAMSSKNSGRQGRAWTFVPESEWDGESFDHAGIMGLYDAEKVQRGDLRGLAVLIKGKRCVIDGAVLVHDASGQAYLSDFTQQGEEEMPEEDDVFA
jgi:hypothetical protein